MKISQKNRVLNYMKAHKKINQLQAIKLWWDWRLSAKIYALKKDGYNIKTENKKVMKSDGSYVYVSEYSLIEDNENHIPRID